MDKILINILKKIEKNGYEAYIVGGYVRDKLMGIETSDIDICTNVLPKDIIRIFKLDKDTKEEFGCVRLITKKYNIDITTYRKESNYVNHIPTKTTYIDDLKSDLKRRDFRMNTLIMNYSGEIFDYYNGLQDINNKVIRCVGDTKKKLLEDPLRILRGIRFSIKYNFKLDDNILVFIKNNKELFNKISYFRKKEELDKIFSCENKLMGLKLIEYLDLCDSLGINYELDKIKYTKDILGIYSQIEYSELYPFTKSEKDIINKCRMIIKLNEINNQTLYYYGLYINSIAGEVIGVDYKIINKKYKYLPIKSRKDIKISLESIVKLNNNCYNGVNEIYKKIEVNILDGKLKNKNKDIVKFIRK